MAAPVFQLLTPAIRDGKELKTNGAAIKPGLLVQLDSSGSTVSLASSTAVYGIAYGGRYQPYRPTTETFATDEPLTVVWGFGEALLSSDFFTGGSLPTIPTQLLYAATNGLWHVTGTKVVGSYTKTVSRFEPVGGIGSSQNLAHVRFNIFPGTQ